MFAQSRSQLQRGQLWSIAGGAFDSDNCWMMINYVQFKWLTERPRSDVGGVTKADQQLRRTKLGKLDSSSRAMGNDIIFDEYKNKLLRSQLQPAATDCLILCLICCVSRRT